MLHRPLMRKILEGHMPQTARLYQRELSELQASLRERRELAAEILLMPSDTAVLLNQIQRDIEDLETALDKLKNHHIT